MRSGDSYLAPSYNVALQTMQPVVRLIEDIGKMELTVMRWGLVPFWIPVANCVISPIVPVGRKQRFGSVRPEPRSSDRLIAEG
ncbi:MAG: SOS response-associated peptidase family protein [Terracidiphilus sp.]